MERFDVIVIGGGIAGASAAHALAKGNPESGRRACRVALVDAYAPGHTRGSSHGDGRIARFTYPEPAYQAMITRAYAGWADLEREAGVSLLETTGSWECGAVRSRVIADLERGMDEAGVAYERLTAGASRVRFPQIAAEDDRTILYQAQGAIVRADAAVRALWQSAERNRAELFAEQRVGAVEIVDGGVRVVGEGPALEGRSLVIAAGGWSRGLLRPLGLDLPLTVCREVLAYFPPKTPNGPDHTFHSMPAVVDYDEDRVFYALPQIDVPGVKVGWHHSGPETEASRDETPDPKVLRGLVDFAKRRFPHLDSTPIKTLTCLYTNTPDYHFVLDRHPELPQIVIGTGFSGHGFKFGPVIGEILADLATNVASSLDLDTFRVSRFAEGSLQRRTGA